MTKIETAREVAKDMPYRIGAAMLALLSVDFKLRLSDEKLREAINALDEEWTARQIAAQYHQPSLEPHWQQAVREAGEDQSLREARQEHDDRQRAARMGEAQRPVRRPEDDFKKTFDVRDVTPGRM